MRQPDFNNLLKILNKQVPDRPALFELFLNESIYRDLCGQEILDRKDELQQHRIVIHGFKNAGYDYASLRGSDFQFSIKAHNKKNTISLNENCMIFDEESFEKYKWQEPDDYDYSRLEKLDKELPEGMKLIVWGPGGVLENAIELTGFENLCLMVYENPDLAQRIFDEIGSRLVRYYELSAPYASVGALISNDDWGFKTQTMLSPAQMRKYVFPWHKQIVEAGHKAGKPVILHSCGNLEQVMDDIIDDMKYDAKHSYEDSILPVEQAYERWGHRIAIMGGMDMDFMCRSTPEEVKARCRAMLDRVSGRGSYALGTGNSVPEYIPRENYFAMTSVAHE
jgi:uroporphyrinogen decarboxylase